MKNKLTSEELAEILLEGDYKEVEREHIKYSSFYITCELIIDQETVNIWKDTYELEPYLGMKIVAGMFDDGPAGIELDEAWLEQAVIIRVPENVIPTQKVVVWEKLEN